MKKRLIAAALLTLATAFLTFATFAAPTTTTAPSADWRAGYEAGYADAVAKRADAWLPAPPAPPAPPPYSGRTILPAENPWSVIDAAPKSASVLHYRLTPGATYHAAGSWSPRNGNFELDMRGAQVVLAEPAGASSGIKPTVAGVDIHDGTMSFTAGGGQVLWRPCAAGSRLTNVTLTGPTIASFALVDLHGTDALIQGCTSPMTNSVTIYVTEDGASVLGCKLRGSVGETVLRVDSPAGTAFRLPRDVHIEGCEIWTIGATNRKGALEFRYIGAGSWAKKNVLHDYGRVGQDGQSSAGQSVAGLLLDGNTFVGAGPIGSGWMIKNGVVTIGTETYCTARPITMSGPAQVTFSPPLSATADLYNVATLPANVRVIQAEH